VKTLKKKTPPSQLKLANPLSTPSLPTQLYKLLPTHPTSLKEERKKKLPNFTTLDQ